jgi:hypothetical protein
MPSENLRVSLEVDRAGLCPGDEVRVSSPELNKCLGYPYGKLWEMLLEQLRCERSLQGADSIVRVLVNHGEKPSAEAEATLANDRYNLLCLLFGPVLLGVASSSPPAPHLLYSDSCPEMTLTDLPTDLVPRRRGYAAAKLLHRSEGGP